MIDLSLADLGQFENCEIRDSKPAKCLLAVGI